MSERDWAAEARELVDAWVTTLDTQAGSWLTFDDLLRLRAATEASLRAAAAVPAGCVRALEFYADPKSYDGGKNLQDGGWGGSNLARHADVFADAGQRAQAALAAREGK